MLFNELVERILPYINEGKKFNSHAHAEAVRQAKLAKRIAAQKLRDRPDDEIIDDIMATITKRRKFTQEHNVRVKQEKERKKKERQELLNKIIKPKKPKIPDPLGGYQIHSEAFSLNPFKKNQQREIATNDATTAKGKLKEFLDSINYRIIKGHGGSYHLRSKRIIAYDPKEHEDFNYKKDPVLSIPEMRELFSLAHEVGHAIQWENSEDLRVRYTEFKDMIDAAPEGDHFDQKEDIAHLQKLWYELNAWVEGMQFIPVKYKKQYKNYAYNSYKSYMTGKPHEYHVEDLLRNMLYRLNFEEQI